MFKKIITIIGICLIVITLTACEKKDSVLFKKDYESVNGLTNASGKEYRKVTINKNNPFVLTTAKEVVAMLEADEEFYVYFGSKLCPWCRSVIEKAIQVANENGIEKIYYVDIWDDEAKEILRDKYTLDDDGKVVLVNEGTDEYNKLLMYFNDILPDYTYAANKNGGSKLDIEEKRIYIPLFVYIANGRPVRSTSGISELQTGSRDELTKEILLDEENLFNDFFISACDENC